MNLQESKLFIEFPYIRLSNLQVSERKKSIISLKYSFCCPIFRPFDSAARGDRITRPPPL
jgi:hypothetical protein